MATDPHGRTEPGRPRKALGEFVSTTAHEIGNRSAWSMCKIRSWSLLALIPLVALIAASCGIHGQYDARGLREDRACLVPEKLTTLKPPLEEYQDQGITLDYDKLVPRPDPRKGVDLSYYREAADDPKSIEQLYYDASGGNERARWLICIMETSARFIGRESARYMASLNCQTLTNCRLRFDKLPFSQQTASGARLLSEVRNGFTDQSKIEGAKQDLVGHALVLLIGAKVATSTEMTPGRPPVTSTRPPDPIAKQPYNPQTMRSEMEAAHPGKVLSTTMPSPRLRSVKPNKQHSRTAVVYDQRGFPIFDDVAVYDTRLPRGAWLQKSSIAHMKAATRSLHRSIQAGQVPRSQFTTDQIAAIEAGNAKIPGYTWHHHQDPGRMQLVPQIYHQQSGHVGGAKMWGTK